MVNSFDDFDSFYSFFGSYFISNLTSQARFITNSALRASLAVISYLATGASGITALLKTIKKYW